MNQYLKVSVEKYPEILGTMLIHPISNMDAEIIIEIGQILKKAGLEDVKAIWDKYKFHKDLNTRDALLQWNIDHPEKPKVNIPGLPDVDGDNDANTPPKPSRDILVFKDFRIDVAYVKAYERRDEFDYVKSEMQYLIIINPIPESTGIVNPYSNKILTYTSMERRDQDLDVLDGLISQSDKINLIF